MTHVSTSPSQEIKPTRYGPPACLEGEQDRATGEVETAKRVLTEGHREKGASTASVSPLLSLAYLTHSMCALGNSLGVGDKVTWSQVSKMQGKVCSFR